MALQRLNGGPLALDLRFRVGDTWSSEEWAVLVNGGPVDLTVAGWTVRAQCRERPGDSEVLAEWSLGNGRVRLGLATFKLFADGPELTTSTVQLHHGPGDIPRPFDGHIDCEITRRAVPDPDQPDPDPDAAPLENYTIAAGRCRAEQDVTR